MVNTKEFSDAVSEVLDIIKHLDEEYVELIPLDFIKKLNEEKSNDYIPNIDYTKPLEECDLKPDTRDIIAMIYLDYLCTDDEREELIEVFKDNDIKHQEQLKEKYSPNIFDKQADPNTINNLSLVKVEEKENFLKKIFRKLFR